MDDGDARHSVLDYGYLGLVESYGSDESIIEAARMSTGKGFRTWSPYQECTACGLWRLFGQEVDACSKEGSDPVHNGWEHRWRDVPKGDAGLLGFLYSNRHSTPFEMAGAIIEVQAPIMVFREWHRHRTQSYNEMSARYVPLPDVNYIPSVERLLINSKTNKQAGVIAGADELTAEGAEEHRADLKEAYEHDELLYQKALKRGVPKELARLHLPVGRYSRMRAHANLRNWLLFLTLRIDKAAQWEIRQYAGTMHEVLSSRFPRTMELFDGGRA